MASIGNSDTQSASWKLGKRHGCNASYHGQLPLPPFQTSSFPAVPCFSSPSPETQSQESGRLLDPSLSLHHIQPASVACASPPGGPSALALSPGCLSLSGAPRLWLAPQSQLK